MNRGFRGFIFVNKKQQYLLIRCLHAKYKYEYCQGVDIRGKYSSFSIHKDDLSSPEMLLYALTTL